MSDVSLLDGDVCVYVGIKEFDGNNDGEERRQSRDENQFDNSTSLLFTCSLVCPRISHLQYLSLHEHSPKEDVVLQSTQSDTRCTNTKTLTTSKPSEC